MLRRPLQSRRPYILRLCRLASTQVHLPNPKKNPVPKKDPNARANAVRALANSLVIHRLTGGAIKPSSKKSSLETTIHVTDPETKKRVTLDLRTVKPFTPEFALLPLQYRTLVERWDLLETIRSRQRTAYEMDSIEEDDDGAREPDRELVKKYLSEFLKNRRYTTDKPPSDRKISQYIELAKEKALREERKLASNRIIQVSSEDGLSFEEQWRRRQTYGEKIIKPMTPKSIVRYSPYRDLRNPVRPRDVTIEHLIAAGSHIGHNKSSCHPFMKPFIYGLHDTNHIINLDYTLAHLRRACNLVREVSFRHGIILLIGTRKGHKQILINATDRMGAYMLFRKWIPGTLTNGKHVLFRGYVKEDPTPFQKYAKDVSPEDLLKLPPELENTPILQKYTWDLKTKQWIPSKTDKVGPSMSATPGHSEQLSNIRGEKDVAAWMAWDKFASIVEGVADLTTDMITLPQQWLHTSLAINAEYIPDHGDYWYTRQLANERAAFHQRTLLSNELGDRNPIEMHKMDEFLARRKYTGYIRGEQLAQSEKRLEVGFAEYPRVKIFRDGSALVGRHRFDKDGKPLMQYSDGSYMFNNKLYDKEGKRYDGERDSFTFSDGSELKFQGEGLSRKLFVVIQDKMYDVTSTIAGSAQKREILQRADEYLKEASTQAITEGSDPLPSTSFAEDNSNLTQLFDGAETAVEYEYPSEVTEEDAREEEEEESDLWNDDHLARGSEMLEAFDQADSDRLDELAREQSRQNLIQEDRSESEDVHKLPETPLDNLFTKATSTIRPDLIIVLNPRENRLALQESANNQIPTIGIIDTDCDPRCVTYSIPANDDSLRSIEFIMGVLSRAGEEGQIHRNRYAEQFDFQLRRAKQLLTESSEDCKVFQEEEEVQNPRVQSIAEKYCKLYGLDQSKTEMDTLLKMAAQHIIMAQNEIMRLRKDTTGWSMQDFLDHVKTSTQFPGTPESVLQEMAQVQLETSREAWAESREKVKLRDINYAPERFNGRIDTQA